MTEPYKTVQYPEGIVVKVFPDDLAENPILDDCVIQVSCWHRRYGLGNNHDHETPEDFREFCQEQEKAGDPVVKLPVYLYDHSGLTVNTTGFSCPWDSGQVGWVWVLQSQAQAELGVKAIAEVDGRLNDVVRLLDDFLTGNVYGYSVEDRNGNVLDSCWGFYGDPAGSSESTSMGYGFGGYILDEAGSAARHHVEEARKAREEYEAKRSLCYAI